MRRRQWSAEWVLDGDCAELLAVLQVLRVEDTAACVLRGGDDEAVVPAEAIALLDADGIGDQGNGGWNDGERAKGGGQVVLGFLCCQFDGTLDQGPVEELLDDLVADYCLAFDYKAADEIVGDGLLYRFAVVDGVDKDIAVEEGFTAHSAPRACTCGPP